jgi:hypothetical protein
MDAENMVLSYFHIPEVQWGGGGGDSPETNCVHSRQEERENIKYWNKEIMEMKEGIEKKNPSRDIWRLRFVKKRIIIVRNL